MVRIFISSRLSNWFQIEILLICRSSSICSIPEYKAQIKDICMELKLIGNSLPIDSETEKFIKDMSGCQTRNFVLEDSIGDSKPRPREVGVCYLGNGIIKCVTKGRLENSIIFYEYNSLYDLCQNPKGRTFKFNTKSSQKSSRGCFWFLSWLKFWRR